MANINSKRELERLRAERRRPTINLDCTIGGAAEYSVHKELDALRERRIAVMANRLTEIRGHVENEFAVSQQQNRACRDFERSR